MALREVMWFWTEVYCCQLCSSFMFCRQAGKDASRLQLQQQVVAMA